MAAKRIVAGVDGSPASIKALQWAIGQAEATGASVTAVYAWEVPSSWGTVVSVMPGEHLVEMAEEKLAEAISEATVGGTDVAIEPKVAQGHPARILLEESKDAELLVMGNRGHGGFVGALLGSVTQHCIHHATCPVLVTRD